MRPKELEKLLRDAGWKRIAAAGKGSHRRYYHEEKDELVTLPWHNRDLAPGTLHSIFKIAGIK